jgi:parallel beta-helix repeat protein
MFSAAFPVPTRRRATLLGVLGAAAVSLLAMLPMPVSAASDCSLVAAETGSDNAAGTAAEPFRTAQKLANALEPGQVGCVRGTLTGDVAVVRPEITLTSEPGQRGRLVGKLWIAPEGSGATVKNLDLDGRRTNGIIISPVITGDDATFIGNDVTNGDTGICFIIGSSGHDGDVRADRTRIEGNRIHNCGTSNNHMHGIYVEHAMDTRIVGNEIYDNADRGIQLYPYAVNTTISGNVIDGNGEGIAISGYGDRATSGTRVVGNVITNTRLRAGIESWFPGVDGTDNLVEGNCFAGAKTEAIDFGGGGFEARGNLFTDPQFVDRGAKDFRLRDGSPCAELLAAGRLGAPVPPVEEADPVLPSGELPVTPSGTSTPRPSRPASSPVGPAADQRVTTLQATDRRAVARAARVYVRVARSPRKKWARVQVRLLNPPASSVLTLVEVRTEGGRWRALAAPRLRGDGVRVFAVRLPPGRRLQVRAAVVEENSPVVTRFRATARAARS